MTYELRLGGRVTEHTNISSVVARALVENFQRHPELANVPGLKEKLRPVPGEISHNGHPLTGCADCIAELRQPFQPYGYDQ